MPPYFLFHSLLFVAWEFLYSDTFGIWTFLWGRFLIETRIQLANGGGHNVLVYSGCWFISDMLIPFARSTTHHTQAHTHNSDIHLTYVIMADVYFTVASLTGVCGE